MKRLLPITISAFIVPVFVFSFLPLSLAAATEPPATPTPGSLQPSAEDLEMLKNFPTPTAEDYQQLNQLKANDTNKSSGDIQFFPGGEATLSPELQAQLAAWQNGQCVVPWWRYAMDIGLGLVGGSIVWLAAYVIKLKKLDKPSPDEKC